MLPDSCVPRQDCTKDKCLVMEVEAVDFKKGKEYRCVPASLCFQLSGGRDRISKLSQPQLYTEFQASQAFIVRPSLKKMQEKHYGNRSGLVNLGGKAKRLKRQKNHGGVCV